MAASGGVQGHWSLGGAGGVGWPGPCCCVGASLQGGLGVGLPAASSSRAGPPRPSSLLAPLLLELQGEPGSVMSLPLVLRPLLLALLPPPPPLLLLALLLLLQSPHETATPLWANKSRLVPGSELGLA